MVLVTNAYSSGVMVRMRAAAAWREIHGPGGNPETSGPPATGKPRAAGGGHWLAAGCQSLPVGVPVRLRLGGLPAGPGRSSSELSKGHWQAP